ncbi:hypothetical protein UFOVP861_35 [uncultured Caudovirales phage]|jgi:hypothetical protein|uniref:Uncharacterized protein n=1 Tax=uncultured Caudovirales phage TaxID=2100421 RepID=A0A6J5PJ20_9CAUD|nr:hypothetical protein UFOVP861_35 [uncultured Caudovirales phage]
MIIAAAAITCKTVAQLIFIIVVTAVTLVTIAKIE